VEFTNLSISYYGVGYQLVFESNFGHVVCSYVIVTTPNDQVSFSKIGYLAIRKNVRNDKVEL